MGISGFLNQRQVKDFSRETRDEKPGHRYQQSMIAHRVLYEGHVQGVGFRYATKNIARGFDVTGWVKNLPDGRVELQAMAYDESELQAFLDEISINSPLAGHIKCITAHPIPPLVGVRGFEIVR
jgi:acylphosphatase